MGFSATTYPEILIKYTWETVSKYIYDKFVEVNERGYEAIRIAQRAGVKVRGGRDLTATNTRYASVAVSHQAKARGPMAAIVSFTKTNAEIMNISDRIGALEPVKYADLLLINRDPLEDIDMFRNQRENILIIMEYRQFHNLSMIGGIAQDISPAFSF